MTEPTTAQLQAAREECKAARWPEQHRDDCEWCAYVSTLRCLCSESPEAWRRCPLPQHDHTQWTEHGWNCPASCDHPLAEAARIERETGVNPLAVGCPGDD